ncbi:MULTISPECIES: SecDF P1 head subdomain-containing protein [unclassified Bradyrhizobium]|uniref:SecDF P1 head subdomain-containing protein n=1 Tax=unclassified Bradyrhizobium TaxID=2631580 RepID=UPI002916E214|nr:MULTISPECIES: hypothetical protein [unclassified Bradyrhizobium]
MKSLRCRSLLIAVTTFVLISGCAADELVVVLSSAKAGHDERTGRPILNLIFAETSKETLRILGNSNLGQPLELRLAGRTLLTPVIREPMGGGTWQISDRDWTDQEVIDLAKQLNNAPKGELEVRTMQPRK